MKKFLIILLLGGPAVVLSAQTVEEDFSSSQTYSVGRVEFSIPGNWEVDEDGMSFFTSDPNQEFYISGMVFYGLPDIKTARTGIMPLTRDMFAGFTISSEKMTTVFNGRPALSISATGFYKGKKSVISMLIINGGDQFPILHIFGTDSGWADNLSVADNLFQSINLQYPE